MDGRMHRKTAAWACLHVKDDVWRRYISEVSEAGTYPDEYIFGEDAEDKTGWDRYWRELVLLPCDGGLRPMHRIYDTLRLRETYPGVIRYLAALSVNAFREGNEELAVKAGGVLTHLVGDTIQPAHTTDNRLVTKMWPQERYGTRFMTHTFMELVLCDLDSSVPYEPRTLGTDLDSFVWRLTEELESGKQESIGEIPILMDAILKHDDDAARVSAERTALNCARLDADVLHTLSAIAAGSAKAEPQIEMIRLCPCEVDVDNMFNYEPMINYLPSKSFDHGTRLDIGEGDTDGICLLPMMAQSFLEVRKAFARYWIENSGYERFSCKVGIQRFVLPEDVPFHARGNETPVYFEIRLDGKTVWRSEPVQDGDAPVAVEVSLDDAKEIELYVRDARDPNPLTRFVYPVFANPVLKN